MSDGVTEFRIEVPRRSSSTALRSWVAAVVGREPAERGMAFVESVRELPHILCEGVAPAKHASPKHVVGRDHHHIGRDGGLVDPLGGIEGLVAPAQPLQVDPHEYVVEGKADDRHGFTAFARYIAEHGYRARWRHLPPNRYLELDGWRYWTMPGRGDDSITIINRERLPGQPLRREDPPECTPVARQ